MSQSERIANVKALIQACPDFPKKGILFRDIFPVLRDPDVSSDLISLLVEHINAEHKTVDVIIGLESRGFIFGPLIAAKLNASFVPIRKKGKLPGELARIEYSLEYGTDVFEAQKHSIKPGQKVIIVDDLLATGGTMSAACKLMQEMGAEILECMVVIELCDLKGRDKVTPSCFSLVQY